MRESHSADGCTERISVLQGISPSSSSLENKGYQGNSGGPGRPDAMSGSPGGFLESADSWGVSFTESELFVAGPLL